MHCYWSKSGSSGLQSHNIPGVQENIEMVLHHGMEGHNGGIPSQGFQEEQLCLFPASFWKNSRSCFSLAVAPLPVSCCAACAVLV